MPEPLRVVIAEDHYLVREGTRKLLEDSGEVSVEAAVGTATELEDAVRRMRPDAVITDIRMPPGHHMEGIEAAHVDPRRAPGRGGRRALPARRRGLCAGAAEGRLGGLRLPAEGSARPRSTSCCGRCARWWRAAR